MSNHSAFYAWQTYFSEATACESLTQRLVLGSTNVRHRRFFPCGERGT